MNKKILVPLGQYERSEDMIPYVEKVARPGMEVIFSCAIRLMASDGKRKNTAWGPP